MLETAIIGGGLCGVALARSLIRQGKSVALFDARERLGGRIRTVTGAKSGVVIDLGPTWYWPQTQPLITSLIAELGLPSLPQYDDGALLHLVDPDKTPEIIEGKKPHEDARRLDGGMAALIDALAASVPADRIHLGHVLTGVRDRGDHVVLTFAAGDDIVTYETRHVVLALPPRLLAEGVTFEPELDVATSEAIRGAETWMATHAKVVIEYDRPYWREAGRSGSAYVTHEQAVVGEIFDACDATGTKAALGGFLALTPDLRASFAVGLELLIESQMRQVFGSAIGDGEQYYQDWANEPFTCSAGDKAAPAGERADIANPMLRRALWKGRLYLGSSETAARSAGHLEGALEAARRIERELIRRWTLAGPAGAVTEDPSLPLNAASIARFSQWVAAQVDPTFDDYRNRLTRSLAHQQDDQLTQRGLLESMEDTFDRALDYLEELEFDMAAATVERGRSSLIPELQRPFGALMQTVMDDVIAFNRTSCALSNFKHEHHLSKEYKQVILRDIAAAWQEFLLSANRLLLAKADAARRPRSKGLEPVRQ